MAEEQAKHLFFLLFVNNYNSKLGFISVWCASKGAALDAKISGVWLDPDCELQCPGL